MLSEVMAEPTWVPEGKKQARLGITIVLYSFGMRGLSSVSGSRACGQERISEVFEIRSWAALNSVLRV